MRSLPIALALAGLAAASLGMAKPVARKATAPRKPSPKAQSPKPAKETLLEPDVQFKASPSRGTVKPPPRPAAAPPKSVKPPSARQASTAVPGLPVSTLPTEEVAAYEAEIAQTAGQIDKLLTKLDVSGKHKAGPRQEGVKALVAQRERMAQILKDEKVSNDDQAKLDELTRQQAVSAYMLSTSLILTQRTSDAKAYLQEILNSQPEDSHIYRAARTQIRSLGPRD